MDTVRHDWNVCDLSYTLDGFHERYRQGVELSPKTFVNHFTKPLITGQELASIMELFPSIGASDIAPSIFLHQEDTVEVYDTVIAIKNENIDDLEEGQKATYSILLYSITPTAFTAFGTEKAMAAGLLISGHSIPVCKVQLNGLWIYQHYLPVTIVSPFKDYEFEDKDPLIRVTVVNFV
jgi:hypothetical protein